MRAPSHAFRAVERAREEAAMATGTGMRLHCATAMATALGVQGLTQPNGGPCRISYGFLSPERGAQFSKPLLVICMAHPRRVKMVQQQIHRELADMLLQDTVLQQAIAPESSLGADMYMSTMATISDVEISRDLQVAKVFISIYGDEREQELVLEGLKSKAKYVRMGLGKRMSLRMTPEVRFVKDDSLERGSRVLALLDKAKQDRERKESGDTSPNQLITPVDADDDFDLDLDLEDKDETPITPKPKKKTKTKAPPKAAAKKVEANDNDFDWDDEEFRDLDFNDDEKIIFIK